MKHFSLTIISFHLIFLIPITQSQSCTSVTPTKPQDCKEKTNPNSSDPICCYVLIGSLTPECVEVKRDYHFALGFINRITYKTYINETAEFDCDQTKHTCGISDPKELYQCRKHSSTSQTCCKLNYAGGNTDCILANYKFDNQTHNETLFGNIVECESSIIAIGYLIKLGVLIGIFTII